jgi:diguanylate cyclase (GGDEF)-like protein
MRSETEPSIARRPVSLRRRLFVFAAAVLAPLVIGALVCGAVLLHSASRSQALAEETAAETQVSVTLFQGLQRARIGGSEYMEEGEREGLADFRAAAGQVDRALASPIFDEAEERERLREVGRQWKAAVRQLESSKTDAGSTADGGPDPEDVFEELMNAAIGNLEQLVSGSDRELRADLATTRRLNRGQTLIALIALLTSLGVAAVLAGRLAAATLRPIQRLTQAARAFGSGHLSHRVQISSSAELHEMAETFNRMADALQGQHNQLEEQAFTDSLTGIANRALFEDRAAHALERGARTGERTAVLLIDLDDFKLVNDGLGHARGDDLLTLAAGRITDGARTSDTVARLGGDEFAVLLEGVRGLDDALGAAERIRRLFDTPFYLDDSDVVVTASIGIALASGAVDAEELLRRADLAMYRVKEHGKNGAVFFDPAMEDRAVDRLDILSALRKAIVRDELVAHYQPIVNLESGDVVAAEALLRWKRPGHGLVPPLDFIPLAEETGLIQPIGAWILHEACHQACEWRKKDAPGVRVNVNVSARQLIDPDFETIVSGALASTGLAPEALVLEVTESSVMQNPELTIPKLERILATGVQLALDDFGEGYSSLSHLRRLPVQGLKIARPFIRELADPAGDARLVRGIIELAHSLGLSLVAEGIEEVEQRDALRGLGCPLGQGFLFSRPVDAKALRALLREQAVAAPRA